MPTVRSLVFQPAPSRSLTLSEDYLNSNGWKGHSIRLALGIKDENAPNSLLRLRGPEDSLGDSSQRYYPAGHSCPLPTSVLLSLPVSPA